MTQPSAPAGHDPLTCTRNHCHGAKRQGEPGQTCTMAAGWGTDHPGLGRCKLHGGSTPNHRAAAAARTAEADARRLLAHEGFTEVTDPVSDLARLATEAWAMKDALAARVNALGSVRYSAVGAGTEQLRSEVVLYERALDRTAKLLEALAKLGYEERRTRIAEEDGRLIAAAVSAVLRAHGVDPDTEAVREDVRRELRLIPGGQAA